jgi:Centromere DNA-binding protein complex CBF3 subunit, domain 2
MSDTESDSDADGPLETTEAEVAKRTRELAVANARRVPGNKRADDTYKREWKNYKAWVSVKISLNLLVPSGTRFLTRTNVDAYFNEVVVNKTVQAATARRVVCALQYYADREEYTDGQTTFTVDSPSVIAALKTQEHLCLEHTLDRIVDPHSKLPNNMLTADEIRRVLTEGLTQGNWKDFCTCWNLCENTYLRCDSVRKLCLSDLYIDFTSGPVPTGPNSRIMVVILQKKIHKEKCKRIRVVGAWRSKDFLRCCTGMTAFNLFVSLYDNTDLHFFRSTVAKAKPPWQLHKIINGWSSGKAAAAAYQAIYTTLSLSWYKQTHVKTLGMNRGSKAGMKGDELGTLSKHITEKIDCYKSELYPPLLKVMSLHTKDESYFVPRTKLELPEDITEDELVRRLFPRIDEWRSQQESGLGDNQKKGQECAAHNFLWEVLPFFAMVIFQDGAYWLRDFPDSAASRLLVYVMPEWYLEWAGDAVDKVEEMTRNRGESQITVLNSAVQAAFGSLGDKLDAAEDRSNARIAAAEDRIDSKLALLVDAVADRLADRMAKRLGGTVVVDCIVQQGAVQLSLPLLPRVSMSPVTTSATAVTTAATAVTTAATSIASIVEPPNHPTQLKVPAFPSEMPKSMRDLLLQHQIYSLDSFSVDGSTKKHWPQAIKQAFSRRMFLYTKIHEQASRYRVETEDFQTGKLPRAATELDKMRNGRSLSKFMEHLKQFDPSHRPRKKRKIQV